jgi:hypothetical protein
MRAEHADLYNLSGHGLRISKYHDATTVGIPQILRGTMSAARTLFNISISFVNSH